MPPVLLQPTRASRVLNRAGIVPNDYLGSSNVCFTRQEQWRTMGRKLFPVFALRVHSMRHELDSCATDVLECCNCLYKRRTRRC